MKIGVLALQGSFKEHITKLEELNQKATKVRSIDDAKKIDALIIPGGESTVLMKLLKSTGLDLWIQKAGQNGLPIYGTCAGMIVLSKDYLSLIDIEVDRNAYGSQLDSFEDEVVCHFDQSGEISPNVIPDSIRNLKIKAIFIRAPRIKSQSPNVQTLATHKETPVLVQQNNILVGSFHPELSEGNEIYKYFLKIAEAKEGERNRTKNESNEALAKLVDKINK